MLTPVEQALWILIDRLAFEDIKELIESSNILREGSRLGSLAATNTRSRPWLFASRHLQSNS